MKETLMRGIMISRRKSVSFSSSPAGECSRIDCLERSSALAVWGIDACSNIINESCFCFLNGLRCGDVAESAEMLDVSGGTAAGIAEVVAVAIGSRKSSICRI